MIIRVPGVAGGRNVEPTMFADITPKTVLGFTWDDDGLGIQFAVNLSAEEIRAVERRCATHNPTEEALYREGREAYIANRTFLALTSPTTAQSITQVQALTRQTNALIRLALGQFSDE